MPNMSEKDPGLWAAALACLVAYQPQLYTGGIAATVAMCRMIYGGGLGRKAVVEGGVMRPYRNQLVARS